MRTVLFAATAALTLLAGCREAAEDAPENEAQSAATNAAREAPDGTGNTSDPTGANALGAAVSGERAKQLMHERHEGMEDIGDAMKVLSRELKGDNPNLSAVRTNAAVIANLAPRVSGWFPPGTGPEVGKTESKPEIWQKPQDFAIKTRDFQQAAARFNTAALGTDVAAMKAAHGDLGKSCKACHDPYRAKKQ
jgi:cytochrome c556